MTGTPASASPPSNNDIANATEITSPPLQDVVDPSQATWNFSTDSSRCGGFSQSVWYSFTPASDERVAFDPSTSSYYIAIDVFTGSPGALSFVGCRPSLRQPPPVPAHSNGRHSPSRTLESSSAGRPLSTRQRPYATPWDARQRHDRGDYLAWKAVTVTAPTGAGTLPAPAGFAGFPMWTITTSHFTRL